MLRQRPGLTATPQMRYILSMARDVPFPIRQIPTSNPRAHETASVRPNGLRVFSLAIGSIRSDKRRSRQRIRVFLSTVRTEAPVFFVTTSETGGVP